MNDFLLIFMGIFILLLILLIFILLAYVYHTYTTYTVDINKNLETSEDNINKTATAFNKLQDNIINELAKVNKNQETIIEKVPENLTSLNNNILDIFEFKDNKNDKITDLTKNKINIDNVNVVKPFTSYKNLTTITDNNNYFTVCNSKSGVKRSCVRMNIDDSDMFNIYTCNLTNNNSNIKGINIYDSNNNVLASFDQFNRKILLGSGLDSTAAIKIIDNVYTPDVIVCKYKITNNAETANAAITAANSPKNIALAISTATLIETANTKKTNATSAIAISTVVTPENALSLATPLITAATDAKNAAQELLTKAIDAITAANNAAIATNNITSVAINLTGASFTSAKDAALATSSAAERAAGLVSPAIDIVITTATAAKDAANKALTTLNSATNIGDVDAKNTNITNATTARDAAISIITNATLKNIDASDARASTSRAASVSFNLASVSSSVRQRIGALRPTPRGSKPTMS